MKKKEWNETLNRSGPTGGSAYGTLKYAQYFLSPSTVSLRTPAIFPSIVSISGQSKPLELFTVCEVELSEKIINKMSKINKIIFTISFLFDVLQTLS